MPLVGYLRVKETTGLGTASAWDMRNDGGDSCMGREFWASVFTMKNSDQREPVMKMLLPQYTRWRFDLSYSSDCVAEHITIAKIADGPKPNLKWRKQQGEHEADLERTTSFDLG